MFLVMFMKKIISIFLTLIVLLLSFSCFAYAEEPVILSIQDEKVYAGDEFTVNVFVSDNSQISGAVIDINYDKEKIEFVSAKEGAILDAKANISIRNIKNDNNYYVRFTYMSVSSSVSAEGILFSVTFKALENASGKTNLKITIPNAADFVNSNLEKISYNVESSQITILDNISIETTTEEPSISESTTVPETVDSVPSETTTNELDENENTNDNNDIILMIVLLLIGVSLICFGIAFAIKKKK